MRHKFKFRISKSTFQKRHPYSLVIRRKNKQLCRKVPSFLWWALSNLGTPWETFPLLSEGQQVLGRVTAQDAAGAPLLSPEQVVLCLWPCISSVSSSWWCKIWLWFMDSCGYCTSAKTLTEQYSKRLGGESPKHVHRQDRAFVTKGTLILTLSLRRDNKAVSKLMLHQKPSWCSRWHGTET